MDEVTLTPALTMLRIDGWQCYVWRDGDAATLVDTGAPGGGARILAAVPGIERIVLTHGHVDHCGGAAALRDATGAQVVAGAGDAAAIRSGAAVAPPVFEEWERPLWERVSVGLPATAPPVPVDVELSDGDELDFGGGAQVLAVPGHTGGSIAVYLPTHRVLFTGDTVAGVGAVTPGVFNQDRAQTIADFRRLAALDVDTVCFGHGDPVVGDAGKSLRDAADRLPD